MKHGIAFRKLGRTSSHRDLMLRNLVSSLLEHGQIKTTVAKAKETARLAEKVITLGKRGDLWAKTTAQAMLFKHDITLPLLFNEYANRYANRPGGYTRMHFYGNRVGDNAPHAIIELVDGPNDIRFAMTARAVGRETAEAVLQGRAASSEPVEGEASSSSVTDGGVLLRPTTQKNLEKTLKYRSEEDKQRFRTMAAEWANWIIAEPKAVNGLRHPVKRIHVSHEAVEREKEKQPGTPDVPDQQRFKYSYTAPEGQRLMAGQRLPGVAPSKSTSPLAIARGRLGAPRNVVESPIWAAATRAAVEREAARGGEPTKNAPS